MPKTVERTNLPVTIYDREQHTPSTVKPLPLWATAGGRLGTSGGVGRRCDRRGGVLGRSGRANSCVCPHTHGCERTGSPPPCGARLMAGVARRPP